MSMEWLMSRVVITDNECWEWQGAKDPKGYGFVKRDKRNLKAHRYAYELANGPIPDGLMVCHTCDNPSCCNPSHLWLGTNRDNILDAVRKGRHRSNVPSGERHPLSKLTDEHVREIRAAYGTQAYSHTAFAKRFGVDPSTIGRVARGAQWKHVD
jgi:hypothetical protein